MSKRRILDLARNRTPEPVKRHLAGPLERLLLLRSVLLTLRASGLDPRELEARLDAAAVIDPDLDAELFRLRNEVKRLDALVSVTLGDMSPSRRQEVEAALAEANRRLHQGESAVRKSGMRT